MIAGGELNDDEAKPCHCPNCGADWSTGEIPAEHVGLHGGAGLCEYGCGRQKHYSGLLGGAISNDRVASWHCLACGHTMPRGGLPKGGTS